MRPARVSVIVPVYNAGDYLAQCLQSVLDQTMEAEDLELILVDDGSTDGSGQLLEEFAARHPRTVLRRQENSGAPGGARNPGLDLATGTFVFFLDADDLLAPDALRRLVTTAEQEGSDVVLGKMEGLGGRRVPLRMFHRTQLDAPLVASKVIYTLGPWKLFRRSLIEDLSLRFPTDQKVGEDQPFVAAAYLNARKITILADQVYYYARRRADGGNITSTTRSTTDDFLQRAQRLTEVILCYTEPGDLRDGVMKRPFAWGVAKALTTRWLRDPAPEQERFAREVRSTMGDLYTPGLRASLQPTDRIRLDLLLAGDLEALRTFVTVARSATDLRCRWSDGAFRLVLPEGLTERLSEEQRITSPPIFAARLERLEVHGTSTLLEGTLGTGTLDGAPDEVVVLAVRRADGRETTQRATLDVQTLPSGRLPLRATLEGLARGTWDVHLVIRCGEHTTRLPFGADRSEIVDPEDVAKSPTVLARHTAVRAGGLASDGALVLESRPGRRALAALRATPVLGPLLVRGSRWIPAQRRR